MQPPVCRSVTTGRFVARAAPISRRSFTGAYCVARPARDSVLLSGQNPGPAAAPGYTGSRADVVRKPAGKVHRPSVDAGAGSGSGGAALPPTDNLRRGDDSNEAGGEDDSSLQAGVKSSDLPQDMQDALAQGRVSDKILKRWSKYSRIPIIGFLCRICPPFRDRILGNPRFLLVLAIELLVGGSAKLSSEAQYRKNRFSKEINMVASDMALEIIADVTVVWLLSTKASFKPQAKTKLSRTLAALPAHAFQVGDFTLGQRASNMALRAAQFMAVGFGSSVIGHTLTSRMVEEQRKNTPKGQEPPGELAPVLPNSLAWGSFMALSANSRYQIINGVEERFLEGAVHNPVLKMLITLAMRFTNTYTGGFQWMWYAGKIGLQ